MDQSGMVYLTPPHDNTAPLVPELRRGENGWSGRGWSADEPETWRVVNNIIKIKYSDGDHSRVPSWEQRQRTVDDERNFSQYLQLDRGNHLYELWMRKIGRYLGDWVLCKNPYASPEWKLLCFPEGYTLWIHKSGVESDPANPRVDAYLYGAPHLSPTTTARATSSAPPAPTVFRSPMEFVEHAIWLMRRGAGRCLCKYCTPGQNQLDINFRLDRGEEVVEEEVIVGDGGDGAAGDVEGNAAAGSGSGSGGDGGAGGSSLGQSAAASRGRGAGTRGRRGRRAKRDRSPPILAKDYRVGNNTPPGPPSPASA